MMVESLSSRLSSLPQRWILSLLKFWKRNQTQCSQIFWWISIMIFWTKLSLCDICLGDITIVVFVTIPDWRKSRKNKCCPNLALVWIHFTYRPGNMWQKCEGVDLNVYHCSCLFILLIKPIQSYFIQFVLDQLYWIAAVNLKRLPTNYCHLFSAW